MTTQSRLIGVAELVDRLGVSGTTVRKHIASGRLPAFRLGKKYKVSETDLSAYLDRSRIVPESTTAETSRRSAAHGVAVAYLESAGLA